MMSDGAIVTATAVIVLGFFVILGVNGAASDDKILKAIEAGVPALEAKCAFAWSIDPVLCAVAHSAGVGKQ